MRLARSTQQLYADGGYYSANSVGAITQIQLVRFADKSHAWINFRAEWPELTMVDSHLATPTPATPVIRDYELMVIYTAQGWQITQATWDTIGGA